MIPFVGKVRAPWDANLAPKRTTSLPIPLFQWLLGAPYILIRLGPLSDLGFHAILKKYAYQARLEDVTSHTLRHSFAKNLVDANTPLGQVATLLGHESLDTTKIYTQPSGRNLQRAVQRAAGENIGENG